MSGAFAGPPHNRKAATSVTAPQSFVRARSSTKLHAREIRTVPKRARAHFAIFRHRGARAAGALPTSVVDLLARFAPLGVNPNLTRAVQTSAGSVWVEPGSNILCVAAARPGSGVPAGGICSTESLSEDGGEYILAGRVGQPTLVSGLVPDGVSNVVVTRGDGSTLTLPVTDNTYTTTITGHVSGVQVGGRTFEMPR